MLIVLIAPNVSEQMGGEGIKALHIFLELKKRHASVVQITHERNRSEVQDRLRLDNVLYVQDTWFSKLLWRSIVFRWWIDCWFSFKAVRLADRYIAAVRGQECGERAVIHQTEPNSPVLPRSWSRFHRNVFGPLNGNIYYPKCFRRYERPRARLRRWLHMPLQLLSRKLRTGLHRADLLLVAGGVRTSASLVAAGCCPAVMRESLDYGLRASLLDRPRVVHVGRNCRFIHYGRLVFHKGTLLALEALRLTEPDVCLDVVGRGPELAKCRAYVAEHNLESRVRFLDWMKDHATLMDSLHQYRGMVLPTIEDANGIVVQEVMAVGLPPICLNWGGPSLLIDHEENGILVEVASATEIVAELARWMNALSASGELAERLSRNGREKAKEWLWDRIVEQWLEEYRSLLSRG